MTDASTDKPVAFTISANGSQLDKTIEVRSVRIWHAFNRIGHAEIQLLDDIDAKPPLPATTNAGLKVGSSLEIQIGRGDDLQTAFKGSITRLQLKLEDGAPSLTVEARDDAFKMTLVPVTKLFEKVKDSDVAQTVARAYGLSTDFTATDTEYPMLLQHQTTDWDFLVARLQLQSQVVWSALGTIQSKKPSATGGAAINVALDEGLLSFEARMDGRDQLASTEALTWDMENQQSVNSDGTDPGVKEQGSITASSLAADMKPAISKLTVGYGGTVDGPAARAGAILTQSRLAKIQGTARLVGQAVSPGDTLQLKGFSTLFDGAALVSAVTHILADGGWETIVETGLARDWLMDRIYDTGGIERMPERLLKQLHLGKVTKISEDPEGLFRVQVMLPLVYGAEAQPVWARVAMLAAGSDRGSFFMPHVDDEVLVGFVGADAASPVVLGKLYSKNRAAPVTPADENNYVQGLYTKAGLKLVFNDEDPAVTLSTKGGQSICLDDKAGSVTIKDQNGNSLTMDSGGIKMTSAADLTVSASAGTFKGSASNVNFDASMEIKGNGGLGAQWTSGANTVVKGAIVQIN
ncbi:phage baseplate assembly protein V [Pseudokordiimonas caeni]|uniref:phage baseplate assembly protein V n=1 Tax=Pseudokordiimonas caeni TaxID=2997908 RepID=UPI002811D06B|nr:phage baseplate assembly protein V [Pseudokordiimonas caeni]